MRTNTIRVLLALTAIAIACATANAQNPSGLAGTSWKLVKLQGADEVTTVPDDGAKYTVTFNRNGRVSARVDCNRGGTTWKSPRPNELEFGSWSIETAKCPAGSLYNRIVREGAAVRTYEIKNGHLFLMGTEAGGYYELEPLTTSRRR